MGRAFEFRRERKEKRWANMSKTFVKIGREIAMSVKQGGPDPDTNPRLRVAIQNAKGANMPKDRIESAIKRSSSKDEKDFEELVYEGYAPFGVAILAETATDNSTRTVANIRMYFTRNEGTMGKTGSLDFIFDRKAVFRIAAAGVVRDDFELEMIECGAEDIDGDEEEIIVFAPFQEFGNIQKKLEELKVNVISSQLQRIPNTTVELTPEQKEQIYSLIEKFEEDDDVQAVYHNMA
jgi:YebC/PmpR family DNA-binding regulatory protein